MAIIIISCLKFEAAHQGDLQWVLLDPESPIVHKSMAEMVIQKIPGYLW